MATFPFDVHRILGGDDAAVVAIAPSDVSTASRSVDAQQLAQIIDTMGSRSARAQGLARTITSASLLSCSGGHTLHVAAAAGTVAGILKVGTKRLFVRSSAGDITELQPLCVLDFYVHERCQRTGVGKLLFESMLRHHGVQPHRLGYDRPSPKLLAFLRKHYGLSDYTPQANGFVVYHRYHDRDRETVQAGAEVSKDALAALIGAQLDVAGPGPTGRAPSRTVKLARSSAPSADTCTGPPARHQPLSRTVGAAETAPAASRPSQPTARTLPPVHSTPQQRVMHAGRLRSAGNCSYNIITLEGSPARTAERRGGRRSKASTLELNQY